MADHRLVLTLSQGDPIALERYVLVMGLGFLRAIREGHMTPDEAEAALFKPGTQQYLAEHHISTEVLDFIHAGFFLDDVLTLAGPSVLLAMIGNMEQKALSLLHTRPYPGHHVHVL